MCGYCVCPRLNEEEMAGKLSSLASTVNTAAANGEHAAPYPVAGFVNVAACSSNTNVARPCFPSMVHKPLSSADPPPGLANCFPGSDGLW